MTSTMLYPCTSRRFLHHKCYSSSQLIQRPCFLLLTLHMFFKRNLQTLLIYETVSEKEVITPPEIEFELHEDWSWNTISLRLRFHGVNVQGCLGFTGSGAKESALKESGPRRVWRIVWPKDEKPSKRSAHKGCSKLFNVFFVGTLKWLLSFCMLFFLTVTRRDHFKGIAK